MWEITMFSIIASSQRANSVLGENPIFLTFVLAAIVAILLVVATRLYLSLRQTRAVLATRTEELLLTIQTQQDNPTPSTDETEADAETEEEAEKVLYGRLFVMKGLEQQEIPIYSEMLTIGRSEEEGCDFTINKPFVSPKHCVIFHKDGVFSIKDLDSKNGVFINGERVARGREVVIPIGSEVEITKEITLELWDPNTMVDFEVDTGIGGEDEDGAAGHIGEELVFKPLLDVRYIPDEDAEIDDTYSPI